MRGDREGEFVAGKNDTTTFFVAKVDPAVAGLKLSL